MKTFVNVFWAALCQHVMHFGCFYAFYVDSVLHRRRQKGVHFTPILFSKLYEVAGIDEENCTRVLSHDWFWCQPISVSLLFCHPQAHEAQLRFISKFKHFIRTVLANRLWFHMHLAAWGDRSIHFVLRNKLMNKIKPGYFLAAKALKPQKNTRVSTYFC